MSAKILFVDDEQNVLDGLRRQLRKKFQVCTALGPDAGLEAIREEGPFAVICSDMKMPGMNGAQFLARARECEPDSVRMILSGHSELESAIAAVNQGEIFRFLTKPCEGEALISGLEKAVDQYRLIIAERELLESTLSGAVEMMSQVLSLVNPEVFSRTSRITAYVTGIASQLGVGDYWQFRIAAMLSQIGCITVPPEVLTRAYSEERLSGDEKAMFEEHPALTARLVSSIPRLEEVSSMIENQSRPVDSSAIAGDPAEWSLPTLGSQVLRTAIEFDRLLALGRSRSAALDALRETEAEFPPPIVAALDRVRLEDALAPKELTVEQLRPRMILDQDIKTKTGALLVRSGEEVTNPMLARMQNFARGAGIVEPFRVLVRVN